MSGIDESPFASGTGRVVLTPVVDLELLDVLHFVAVARVPSINFERSNRVESELLDTLPGGLRHESLCNLNGVGAPESHSPWTSLT